jgi:uncharacterized DUF497 family protein
MGAFEWDPDKDAKNRAKHGISFDEAATIFEGPVLSYPDDDPDDEVRERSIGLLNGQTVICVIHTDRGKKIRIISARKATRNERKDFYADLEEKSR